jgi:hypothetical protein
VNREKTTSLLQLAIAPSHPAEKLGTANLEPLQVVGIVGDTHGIGVAVKDPLFGNEVLSHGSPAK